MSPRTPVLLAVRTALLSCCAAKLGPFDRSISNAIGMERLLLFIVVAVLIPTGVPEKATAQDFSRNSVYAEVATSGRVYSINYERRLSAHIGARAGLLISEGAKNRVDVSTIPVMLNLLDGFHRLGKHRFELGTGPLFGVVHRRLEDGTVSRAVRGGFIIAVGYRYQPFEGGVLFRTGLTGLNSGGCWHQAWHLGIGYTL